MRNDMNGFRIDGDTSRTIADQSCSESNQHECYDQNQRGMVRNTTREFVENQTRGDFRDQNVRNAARPIVEERTRGASCPCSEGNSRGGCMIRDCDGDESRSLAMVYAEEQCLGSIFEPQDAIVRGTLFPCLYKPMCQDNGCMHNGCVTECQKMNFAAWEVRLYLNTHPNDKKALALLRRLREHECCEVGYATAFLEDTCGCSRWSWTDDPWPWEYQCCNEEE